jgi:hypothetical protein
MIANPKHGWCKFKLGDFEGHPSYLTNVPVDLLDAFIEYKQKGTGMAWFDEEETEFTLVLTPYSIFVIEEKEEPILHDFSDYKIDHLAKELINDIEKSVYDWSYFITNDDLEEVEQNKNEIKQKIAILKQLIKKRHS